MDGPIPINANYHAFYDVSANTLRLALKIELDPTVDAYPIVQQWVSAWKADFMSRYTDGGNPWKLRSATQGEPDIALSFSVDFIVLTPGASGTQDDLFPASHVNVLNSDGRSAYFEWKVGGTNAADLVTWSHELGHQFGLKDEYAQVPYAWHIEPPDAAKSLMCYGSTLLKRHVQEITDHAGLEEYLLQDGYTIQ